jgi:hypothetical protein
MKPIARFIAGGVVAVGLGITAWEAFGHRPACAGQNISFGNQCAGPERFASQCESLPPNIRGICNAVITGRIRDLREFVARHRLPRDQEVVLSRRVVTTFPTVSPLLSASTALPIFVCYVGESSVRCARLVSLLAFYNPELSGMMLADLGSLYQAFNLDAQKGEILFRCPNGAWGAESVSAQGSGTIVSPANLTERIDLIMTKKKVDTLLSECDRLKPRSATAGIFSGVTGFLASKGGLSCLKAGADPAVENLRLIHEMLQSFRDGCPASFASSMMEDGANAEPPANPPAPPTPPMPPAPPPTPPTPTPPGNPPITANPDGTKTKTEVVRNPDGTTTQTETTTDAAGKVRSRVVTNWKASGTRTRKEETFNPNGTVEKTLDSKYFDDGTAVHILRGTGGPIEVVQFGNGQGGPPGSGGITVYYPGGGWDMFDDTGRVVLGAGSMFSCADETCSACRSFAETTLKLAISCGFGGGASPNPACQAFTDAASCCGQSQGPRVDPRLIIPNEGGMTCYPNVEPDVRRKMCEKQCGVAGSATNCLGACLASDPADLRPIDVSTHYCIYAYVEDECLPIFGTKEAPEAVHPPIPLPCRGLDRFVLLPRGAADQAEPKGPRRASS